MPLSYEFRGNHHRRMDELARWTKQRTEAALEPDLPIIDPHHHAWDDRRGRYVIEELIEDMVSGHNIRATVFVEAGAMYRTDGPGEMQSVGEVEFANGMAAMAAAGRAGQRRLCAGIVGHADLAQGERVQSVLEALIAAGNGRLRGIRDGVTWDSGPATKFSRRQPPPHQVLNPAFRHGFARLEPLGLSFESWQFFPQLPDLADLLRAFPDTSVILNHLGGVLGLPPHDVSREEVFGVWRTHIGKLARHPNLTIKVGGLGMLYGGWEFHLRDLPPTSEELATAWRPYVETAVEAFGPSRCMMESNFPEDKQSCGYGVLWNALKRITQGCSAAEKAALYHDNAARIYRLGL